jgi:hypothetical protein
MVYIEIGLSFSINFCMLMTVDLIGGRVIIAEVDE